MSSNRADYFFVEVHSQDQEGAISRGSKISHALRRHHREARRERAKKHLASRDATLLAHTVQDLPSHGRASPSPGARGKQNAQLNSPSLNSEGRSVSEFEILQPMALKMALGQGRLDPFNVYPVENISLYIHEILDHAVNHTWPLVSPFGQSSSNPVIRAWLGCAMANPVAFYSFVFAAGLHLAYEHGWNNIPTRAHDLLFSYKTRAIGLVNEALQQVDLDISDALLVSILILAAHGPRAIGVEEDSVVQHPLSPLAGTQNINFYGSLRFDGLHMDALRLLLSRRGGLHTVQLYSLAETIGFGELIGASEHLTPPNLPEAFACPTTVIPAVPDPLPIDFFPSLQGRTIFKDLLSVLRNIASICTALNVLRDGERNTAFFNDILRARNTVQHRVMSLPHRDFILVTDHAIYEACRLAVMIFANIVVFPLPAATNVRPRLAGMLRRTLSRLPAESENTAHRQVLLWAIMLGAIAAANVKEYMDWYHAVFRQHCLLLGIDEWSEVQAVMISHLWFDSVCGPPARKIWTDAMTGFN